MIKIIAPDNEKALQLCREALETQQVSLQNRIKVLIEILSNFEKKYNNHTLKTNKLLGNKIDIVDERAWKTYYVEMKQKMADVEFINQMKLQIE